MLKGFMNIVGVIESLIIDIVSCIHGDKIFPQGNKENMNLLENYQALPWWIFRMGKFLREKATPIESAILK